MIEAIFQAVHRIISCIFCIWAGAHVPTGLLFVKQVGLEIHNWLIYLFNNSTECLWLQVGKS